MSIATDPNLVDNDEQQDEFEAEFARLAEGKEPTPSPDKEPEPAPSEGNDPEDADPAPAEAATTEGDPAETVTSDDATDTEGGGQPPKDTAPDPWADAPPELKALFEQTQKERDEAKHRAASDANRVAALSRKLQRLTEASVSAVTTPDPKAEEAKKALDQKVKQLREDYGDIAEPLIELIEAQGRELGAVKANLTGLSEQQQAQHIAAEQAALEQAHPDWRVVAQSPNFRGWLEVQPENIQRLAASWDARETSVALTLFKAEQIEATGGMSEGPKPTPAEATRTQEAAAATGERRSQQLDGGKVVRSRPQPAASGPPEDFEAAFKYYEEQRARKALANSRR
jgi:hypothetical protein